MSLEEREKANRDSSGTRGTRCGEWPWRNGERVEKLEGEILTGLTRLTGFKFWVKFAIDRGGENMVLYEAMIGEGMCFRHESKK